MGCCCCFRTRKIDDIDTDNTNTDDINIQIRNDDASQRQILTQNINDNNSTNYLSTASTSTAQLVCCNINDTDTDHENKPLLEDDDNTNTETIIDKKDKEMIEHLIWGYVRNIYNSNIGDLIIYLIHAYYGYEQIDAHWDPNLIGSNMELSKNMKTLTYICRYLAWSHPSVKGNWRTGYCSYTIGVNRAENLEIIAEFLIHSRATKDSICIGIELDNCKSKNTNFATNGVTQVYAYCSNNRKYSKGTEWMTYDVGEYDRNDTIYMKLIFLSDLEFGELYFKKNDGDWSNTKYKINKGKKINIAASLYSGESLYDQSSLSLRSVRLKPDIYNKY